MKTPSHQEISQRAYLLWLESGSLHGRDVEFWHEAEKQLASGSDAEASAASQASSESAGASALADRLKSETAAESVVEFQITPAVSDEEAVKAALQKKEARAPKMPAHTGPKPKPPETGKPLWNKAHSA
ncbi:MAG: hypothetical protein JWM35_2406 [Verrucomicrobia bacterium]|nr:hypothetical protein [Verrucomicrobiota bacterium]